MLKYVSKITMDILPSVVATIIGAYIVNHYIVAKPAEKGRGEQARRDVGRRRQHPAAGCDGEGYF
jgi:hypothetical protein